MTELLNRHGIPLKTKGKKKPESEDRKKARIVKRIAKKVRHKENLIAKALLRKKQEEERAVESKIGWVKKKRNKLYITQKGKCYYCGCSTIKPEDIPKGSSNKDTMATLEHVYSKYNPLRGLEPQVYVLSCFKCNHEKGLEDIEKHKNNGFIRSY